MNFFTIVRNEIFCIDIDFLTIKNCYNVEKKYVERFQPSWIGGCHPQSGIWYFINESSWCDACKRISKLYWGGWGWNKVSMRMAALIENVIMILVDENRSGGFTRLTRISYTKGEKENRKLANETWWDTLESGSIGTPTESGSWWGWLMSIYAYSLRLEKRISENQWKIIFQFFTAIFFHFFDSLRIDLSRLVNIYIYIFNVRSARAKCIGHNHLKSFYTPRFIVSEYISRICTHIYIYI